MYLLPITIKKYKTNADSECFIRKIRANTLYKYNQDGYIREFNPNDLLYRNEKEKGIYLIEKEDLISRYGGGGTTAIFISEDENDKTIITTIAYFGWQQSIILMLLLFGLIYTVFFNLNDSLLVCFSLFIFNIFCSLTSAKALKRQKNLIEKAINACLKEN